MQYSKLLFKSYMPARCYPVTEIQLMGAWNMHNWWKFRLLMRLYSSVPLFSDGIPSPDGTLACMILERLKKKALSIKSFLDIRMPSSPLFEAWQILKIEDIVEIYFVHSVLKGKLSKSFENIFQQYIDLAAPIVYTYGAFKCNIWFELYCLHSILE